MWYQKFDISIKNECITNKMFQYYLFTRLDHYTHTLHGRINSEPVLVSNGWQVDSLYNLFSVIQFKYKNIIKCLRWKVMQKQNLYIFSMFSEYKIKVSNPVGWFIHLPYWLITLMFNTQLQYQKLSNLDLAKINHLPPPRSLFPYVKCKSIRVV